MYVPPHYAQTDRDALVAFLARHSFALLVSAEDDGFPIATHLPLILDPAAGPHGTLLGHLARENPHARVLAGRPALAVFSGPHAYVSPTWYAAPNMVPTWNYTAVHATGTAELVEDEAGILDLLAEAVATYEGGMPEPWRFDRESTFARRLAAGVVGLRLPVDRLEGKWKLGQNHPAERRERAAAALAGSDDPAAREVARLMRGG